MSKWFMTMLTAWLVAWLVILLLVGCRDFNRVEKEVPGGDVEAGREALRAYGCSACHVIPGVATVSHVGPPLEEYAERHYIAGNLPNTAENLVHWIQNPQAFEPGTAMPNLNVSENDARNMAAYLYSR
jgi:cytochrome c1